MAKARLVRPETWTDDKFVSVDPFARLLFMGMWNFACDNGHLDDSALQLKMRVLPADNVDVPVLLDSLIELGMVARENGYLKVVNLSAKQPLDLRYLVFCDHCENDPARRYSEGDRKGNKRAPSTSPTGAQGGHVGGTSGTQRRGDGDGDGDGDRGASRRRSPERPIPDDWKPSKNHEQQAQEHGLDLSTEAFRFRNHAIANDRRQRNWNAAFTTWLSKAVDYAPKRPAARNPDMPEGW